MASSKVISLIVIFAMFAIVFARPAVEDETPKGVAPAQIDAKDEQLEGSEKDLKTASSVGYGYYGGIGGYPSLYGGYYNAYPSFYSSNYYSGYPYYSRSFGGLYGNYWY